MSLKLEGGAERRSETAIVGMVIAFALAFRLLTLMPIHSGVDERDYWMSGRAIVEGTAYPALTHRTVRVSVIWPTAALQAVFGVRPNVYYLGPLINSAVQAALAYLLGRRLRGRVTGGVAALALVLFPYMIRAGSQIRPEIYSMSYILAALWCLVSYAERVRAPAEVGARRLIPLLWMAFWVFMAYEAKVTNLFFLPGLAVGVYLLGRRFKDVLVFGGALFGLYLAETAAYAAFTDYPLGQLQVILGSHLADDVPDAVVNGFWDLFKRYARPYLQIYWQLPFLAFAGASAYYLTRRGEERLKALIVASASFFFFVTFAVKDLSPVTPAEDFINRYFCAVLPPLFIVLGAAIEDALGAVLKRAWRPSAALAGAAMAAALGAIAAYLSLGGAPGYVRGFGAPLGRLGEHPLAQNRRYEALLNEAYAAGTPVVSVDTNGGRNALAAGRAYFLRLDAIKAHGEPLSRRFTGVDGQDMLAWAKPAAPGPEALGPESAVVAAVRNPHRLRPAALAELAGMSAERYPGESKRGSGDD